MKKNILLSATMALTVAAASAAPFEWEPAISQPNPALDVTQAWQVQTLRFYALGIEGVAMTDIMPVWIDEDENTISASSGEEGWSQGEFEYHFDFSQFKSNGEYILHLPEGLLTDAAGNPSAKVEIPYSFDIPDLAGMMFDDFEVLSVSPDLSAPQSIWDNQTVTINTNHNDAIGLVKLTVTDKTEDEIVCVSTNFTTGRVPGDNSEISWDVIGTRKFFEGHTYEAELIFYNGKDEHGPMGEVTPIVDKAYYQFEGRVEGFKYSNAELLSVSPEPFSMISTESEAVFVYTFSAPVTCYQPETPLGSAGIHRYSESRLSSNADKTVWTLDLSDDPFLRTIDTSVVINIYARDEEGFQLKGNNGTENNSCFQYSWECELGAFLLEAVKPAMDSSIDSLTEVIVQAVNGQPMSWSWNRSVTVNTADGEYVGRLEYQQDSDDRDSAENQIRFYMWEDAEGNYGPISLERAGEYAVVFEPGCFLQGEQFSSGSSHSLTIPFSISGKGEVPDVDAADRLVDVVDLMGRVILRNASPERLRSLPAGIYIINGRKTVVR